MEKSERGKQLESLSNNFLGNYKIEDVNQLKNEFQQYLTTNLDFDATITEIKNEKIVDTEIDIVVGYILYMDELNKEKISIFTIQKNN